MATRIFNDEIIIGESLGNPVDFFSFVLLHKARDYQEDMLLEEDNICCASARGVGKSWTIRGNVLYTAYHNPDKEGLLTAPNAAHLKPLFEKIIGDVYNSPMLRRYVKRVLRSPDYYIEFSNGFKLQGRIAGTSGGTNVLGLHVDFVWIDEGQLYTQQPTEQLQGCMNEGCIIRIFGVPNGVRDSYLYKCTVDPHFKQFVIEKWKDPTWNPAMADRLERIYGGKNSQGWQNQVCFAPGTSVIVDDMFCKNIEDIKTGDLVISHTGNINTVANVMSRKYNGELIKIKSSGDYREYLLTPEHPVYAVKMVKCGNRGKEYYGRCSVGCNHKCCHKYYKKYKPEWIRAEELTRYDSIVFPINLLKKDVESIKVSDYINRKCFKFGNKIYSHRYAKKKCDAGKGYGIYSINDEIKIDRDFYILLGYYLAEGSNGGGGVQFAFNVKEYAYIQDVCRIIKKIFGIECRVVSSYKDHCSRVIIGSKLLLEFFENICGKGARNKGIYYKDFLYDNRSDGILDGFLRGDGHWRKNRVIGTTVSEKLVNQLNILARSFGMESSISRNEQKEGLILGREVKKNPFCYKINIPYKHSNGMVLSNNDIYIAIKSINNVPYKGKVYNLEVEKDNSYVLPIGSVHNCALWGSLSHLTFPERHWRPCMVEVENYDPVIIDAEEGFKLSTDNIRLPFIQPSIQVSISMDAGYDPDPSIIGIWVKTAGFTKLVHKLVLRKVSYTEQAIFLDQLARYYNAWFVAVDVGGPGRTVYLDLSSEKLFINKPYVPVSVNFGSRVATAKDLEGHEITEKVKFFSTLQMQALFEVKKLLLPNNDLAIEQEVLASTQTKASDGTYIYNEVPDHNLAMIRAQVVAPWIINSDKIVAESGSSEPCIGLVDF